MTSPTSHAVLYYKVSQRGKRWNPIAKRFLSRKFISRNTGTLWLADSQLSERNSAVLSLQKTAVNGIRSYAPVASRTLPPGMFGALADLAIGDPFMSALQSC